MVRGGGTGGFKPPAPCTLKSWLPPYFCWLLPLCTFFDCIIFPNFFCYPPPWESHFLPLFSCPPYNSAPFSHATPPPPSPSTMGVQWNMTLTVSSNKFLPGPVVFPFSDSFSSSLLSLFQFFNPAALLGKKRDWYFTMAPVYFSKKGELIFQTK